MCKGCEIHRKTATVSKQLHRVYDDVLKERVPDDFGKLLAQVK